MSSDHKSSSEESMNLKVKVWRQKSAKDKGAMVEYAVNNILPEMSFLEMLDELNQDLTKKGEDPVAFDHDCREGICGSCSMMINGLAHGGIERTTTCQVHMRNYKNGDTVVIEPWRAKAFPVIKDLTVDRSAFDRIQKAGGYISTNVGSAPEGNMIPVPRTVAEEAFNAGACIQCGACVAACKNASAMLFVAAQTERLNVLPQGAPEMPKRVAKMIAAMDAEQFGSCTNEAECSAVCPKGISFKTITALNHNYLKAMVTTKPHEESSGDGVG